MSDDVPLPVVLIACLLCLFLGLAVDGCMSANVEKALWIQHYQQAPHNCQPAKPEPVR